MDHQPNVEPRGQSMKLSVVRPRAAKARRVSEDIPGAVGADSSNGTRYPDSSTQQKRSPTPGSFRHKLAESYTQSQSLATQLGCLVAVAIYGSPSSILRFRSSSPLLPGIYPQGSHQKQPTVVTSKPANESGLGLACFTPPPPEEASLFSYANSVDRI